MSSEKKKFCKNCGEELNGKVKKCPKCGAKTSNSYLKTAVIVIAVLIAIGIIGAAIGGNEDDGAKVVNGEKTNVEKTKNASKKKIKTTFKIGETVKLGDAQVKVNKVNKSKGSEWESPKDGNEYVIVEVTITNKGDEELSYNVYDFKMQNSKGNITTECFATINSDTSLDCGDLASDGEVTGTIIFEQPVDDPDLTLIYEGDWFTESRINFKLQ